MKKLANALNTVNKEIRALSKKLEQVSKKADNLMKAVADEKAKAKAAPKKKPVRKAKAAPKKKVAPKATAAPAKKTVKKTAAAPKKTAKKPAKKPAASTTPTNKVLTLMKRYKKGVTIAKLKERSGLNDKQISNILHRASKEGKITRVARGVYQVA